MGLNTATVAVHTTPTVIRTFLAHVSGTSHHHRRVRNKRSAKAADSTADAGASVNAAANPSGKTQAGQGLAEVREWPDEDVLYDEGLQIVKRFLKVAKSHTVEELQSFTAMHVPSPNWIHITHSTVPSDSLNLSASILLKHFKDVYGGLHDVGGEHWWQLRGRNLEAEWVEMKKDYLKRTVDKAQVAVGEKEAPYRQDEKVIFGIHGGAYYFSSLDTHRYQFQRHARKLGGRAFLPAYRLAPQYPFPCALQDALAAYLYLVSPPEHSSQPAISPANIVFLGDSAGAGLLLSLLCVIRDSGGQVPMPAGATLISPWVDLTHSFKSIMEDDSKDYIPSEGFHFKPSLAWPPIPGDGITLDVKNPRTGEMETRVLDEQVQQYASNRMIGHPLVSPVNQGSLGGLCPIMIMGGSGELLRDEMMFIAHKAADPTKYPPSDAVLTRYPGQKEMVAKFPPTKVYLQMHDGCAHVTPTLSFTGPAKAMYRAAANFNIWAITVAGIADDQAHERRLKRKQKQGTSGGSSTHSTASSEEPQYGTTLKTKQGDTIAAPLTESLHKLANAQEHDEAWESEESSSSDEDLDKTSPASTGRPRVVTVTGSVPKFVNSIIRERVSVRGEIRPMEPVDECATFVGLDLQGVGAVHGSGPILKWLAAREEWDEKFAKEHKHFRQIKRVDREKAEEAGFLTRTLHDEHPPLASLAGWYYEEYAREASRSVDAVGPKAQGAKSVSGVVSLWMKAGEKDERKRAQKPKQEAKVEALRKKLDDLGVQDHEHLGDKKLEAVKQTLAEQGVDVQHKPVGEVGPAGEDLGKVGDRLEDDDSMPTALKIADQPKEASPGTAKAPPRVAGVILGDELKD